jgi:uncharacterized membrane protein
MSKQEFLELLRRKLNILKDEEINDILQEYEQHIDDEVAAGKSEEQAVENFGDVDELAQEVLDAYQLKTKSKHKTVDKIVKKFVAFDDELLSIVTSLPKGVGFSQKFSLFTIYSLIWAIILVALIFLSQVTGWLFSLVLGGFGTFLNVVFIIFWSMMMLYTILRVISHVWKKRK